jgi:hypothetical protein
MVNMVWYMVHWVKIPLHTFSLLLDLVLGLKATMRMLLLGKQKPSRAQLGQPNVWGCS